MSNKNKNPNASATGREAATLVLADVIRMTGLSYQQAYHAVLQGELDGYQDSPNATRYFTPKAVKDFVANRERAKAISEAIKSRR